MWGIITSVLYIQCGIVSLLVLPILSLHQWQNLIHSNFLSQVNMWIKPWIYAYICLLTCVILNSLRIMHMTLDENTANYDEKLVEFNLQQALAQRNFYISAASLFLLALSRSLVLMKSTQVDELDEFLNFGVEYMPGRNESQTDIAETSSIKELSIASLEDEKLTSYDNEEDLRKWADLDEWTGRIRRITASLVREEKNNEILQQCAEKLSNFCIRLDEDYRQIQEILGSVDSP